LETKASGSGQLVDTATVMETRIRPAAIGENRSAVGEVDEWSKNGGGIELDGTQFAWGRRHRDNGSDRLDDDAHQMVGD
jgi:hypothetical protein